MSHPRNAGHDRSISTPSGLEDPLDNGTYRALEGNAGARRQLRVQEVAENPRGIVIGGGDGMGVAIEERVTTRITEPVGSRHDVDTRTHHHGGGEVPKIVESHAIDASLYTAVAEVTGDEFWSPRDFAGEVVGEQPMVLNQ